MNRAISALRHGFPILILSLAVALMLPSDAFGATKKKAKTAATKKGKSAKAPVKKAKAKTAKAAPKAAVVNDVAPEPEKPRIVSVPRRNVPARREVAGAPMAPRPPVLSAGVNWLGLVVQMLGAAMFLVAMLTPALRELGKAGAVVLVGGMGIQAAAAIFAMGISPLITVFGVLMPVSIFAAFAAMLVGRFPKLTLRKFGRKGENVVDLSDIPKRTMDAPSPVRNDGPSCDFCKKTVPLRDAEVWWRQRFNAAGEVASEPTEMHYGHAECLGESGHYQPAEVTDGGADPVTISKARAEVFLAHRLPELRAWYESHPNASPKHEVELRALEERLISSVRKAA